MNITKNLSRPILAPAGEAELTGKEISKYLLPRFIIIVCFIINTLSAQQLSITRIEQMPNLPVPYEMRNWKQVALGYDSLVFDFNRSGQYLPLVWMDNNGINYPGHDRFGLHTVVGTPYPGSAEAINILPAVISATLVGIDKSYQNGLNWVLMCEEFFNRRPQENVYLNAPVYDSGQDWWYDTMPNIFFYQLYNFYPHTGDFDYQFTTVADRWLQAVHKMGGSDAPWHVPTMNYKGWYLETMTGNTSDFPYYEPEAAGAMGWLLYQAYIQTGREEYCIGAEWCLEFLSNRSASANPAYELQLPYGAYIAARMNAELGTGYDVNKIINWCFTTDGNVRDWGTTLGNWGGYDCYGLIGEAKYAGSGYAFAMNTFEQIGALVPLVRYDDRFSRAIGKWVLNAANAARLFYTAYLPDDNQDSENWAHQYDPHSYIAHEALRETGWDGFTHPFATGDAIRGNWGATNLALYGSSHAGILGAVIDTTNIERILKLDVLKTDYFHSAAYPTYLYFNPYNQDTTVNIDVGITACDVYDAVGNTFLDRNVSGVISFPIDADAAVLLVLTPAGGVEEYDLDKMLINDVVVDYRSGQAVSNYPPRIKSLAADTELAMIDDSVKLYCTCTDKNGDLLTYYWFADSGSFTGSGSSVHWLTPSIRGQYIIKCTVADNRGGEVSDSVVIEVTDNRRPNILELRADPAEIDTLESTGLSCLAEDLDGDSLHYRWRAGSGVLSDSLQSVVTWTAPGQFGLYWLVCSVTDNKGGDITDSVAVSVGHLIAYYTMNNTAEDFSGFNHNGVPSGVTAVEDRLGVAGGAYYFDGVNDYIRIANSPALNNRKAITINFWMNVAPYDSTQEAYPISHGNWENRWKISISNKKIRWTIKTDTTINSGIKDLDSQISLNWNTWYMVTVTYGDGKTEIYINGILNSSSDWHGLLLPTQIDLVMGQHLPGINGYNFKGALDEVRLFNRLLSADEILEIYNQSASGFENVSDVRPATYHLYQNYPNPFNPVTNIAFSIPAAERVQLIIYDPLGRKVCRLINEKLSAGLHQITWDGRAFASGVYYLRLITPVHSTTIKMVLLR
jgi:hypothetical protein